MKEYANLISMGALVLSVFCAGAFLNGERLRTKDLRQELKTIQAEKDAIMRQVDAINQRTYEEEQKILDKIQTAYSLLNELDNLKRNQKEKIAEIRQKIAATQQDIEDGIAVVNATSSFDIDLTPEADSAATDTLPEPPI